MTKKQYEQAKKDYERAIAHMERQIPYVNPYTQDYLRKAIADLRSAQKRLESEYKDSR